MIRTCLSLWIFYLRRALSRLMDMLRISIVCNVEQTGNSKALSEVFNGLAECSNVMLARQFPQNGVAGWRSRWRRSYWIKILLPVQVKVNSVRFFFGRGGGLLLFALCSVEEYLIVMLVTINCCHIVEQRYIIWSNRNCVCNWIISHGRLDDCLRYTGASLLSTTIHENEKEQTVPRADFINLTYCISVLVSLYHLFTCFVE